MANTAQEHERRRRQLVARQQGTEVGVATNDRDAVSSRMVTDLLVGGVAQSHIKHVGDRVSCGLQHRQDPGREVRVNQEAHRSRGVFEQQLPRTDHGGGVLQRREDVCTFEIGVVDQDVVDGPASRQLTDDRAHRRDPHATNARETPI